MLNIIAALDEERGIGKAGTIPWKCPEDLRYFAATTIGEEAGGQNAVIMGANTWLSLPTRYRPLAHRLNIIVSSRTYAQLGVDSGNVIIVRSLAEGVQQAQMAKVNEIYVIGGARLYSEALLHPYCQRLYLTNITGKHDCDVYFPLLPAEMYEQVMTIDLSTRATVHIWTKK